MNAFSTKLAAGGRLVVPASLRKELGVEPGDQVFMEVADGALHVIDSQPVPFDGLEAAIRFLPQPGCSACLHTIPKPSFAPSFPVNGLYSCFGDDGCVAALNTI